MMKSTALILGKNVSKKRRVLRKHGSTFGLMPILRPTKRFVTRRSIQNRLTATKNGWRAPPTRFSLASASASLLFCLFLPPVLLARLQMATAFPFLLCMPLIYESIQKLYKNYFFVHAFVKTQLVAPIALSRRLLSCLQHAEHQF